MYHQINIHKVGDYKSLILGPIQDDGHPPPQIPGDEATRKARK